MNECIYLGNDWYKDRDSNSAPKGRDNALTSFRYPVIDSDMATVTVLRPIAPLVMSAVSYDGRCYILDFLAGHSVRHIRIVIRCVLDVAAFVGKFLVVAVGRARVDVANANVALGDLGRIGGSLTAEKLSTFD